MMTVVRFDTNALRSDHMEEVIEWVRSLGVEPKDVRPTIAILLAEASYELHLSRFVRDEHGHTILDRATDEVVTYPVVLNLGPKRSWPTILNAPLAMDARP